MVKATRRVKRVKRSKKQVHRARDRKTNRRHKTNRRRYTRRQRGGRKITVCERSGFGSFAKGIAITYDTDSQKYTIGNHPYATLKTMPRYTDALDIVSESFPQVLKDDDPVVLDQTQFDKFKVNYCSGFADIGGEQCDSIRRFIPPVASVAPVTAASGAAAAVPNVQDQVTKSLDLKTKNQLKVNEQYIAYMNHSGIVKDFQVDKSKTEYEFDNFTIQLGDSVITGNLKINFVSNVAEKTVTTNFILNLNVDASEIISCMRELIDMPFSGAQITSIDSEGGFFSSKKLKVTGVLTENRDFRKNLSTYDFNYLITAFKDKYQSCSDPVQQMADLRVAGPDDLTRVINSKIAMIDKRSNSMSPEEKTSFEALKQEFASASGNLDLLTQISGKIDQLVDARRARRYPAAATAPSIAGGKTRRKNRIRI